MRFFEEGGHTDKSEKAVVNLTVQGAIGEEQLRALSNQIATGFSGLGFALSAVNRSINAKLNLILDSIGTGNDPVTVAKIRAAAAKLKADTDKLEGAVREHSPEGQG